jgi:hypothetical protein
MIKRIKICAHPALDHRKRFKMKIIIFILFRKSTPKPVTPQKNQPVGRKSRIVVEESSEDDAPMPSTSKSDKSSAKTPATSKSNKPAASKKTPAEKYAFISL